jgi:hypothetical protein
MKTLKEFTESVINPNWTHKLPFGDLPTSTQNEVKKLHPKATTGDKYQYHVELKKPTPDYNGSLHNGKVATFSHRTISPMSKQPFTAKAKGHNDVDIKNG